MGKLEDNTHLYILGESGARTATVGNWLMGNLLTPYYDVGKNLNGLFAKGHNCGAGKVEMPTNERLQEYTYKVAILTDLERIDTLMYLFADKNTNFHFASTYTFNKLLHIAREYISAAEKLDLTLFDDSITFTDTFDTEKMISMYKKYNSKLPSETEILALEETNKLSDIKLPSNHICPIIKQRLLNEQTIFKL